MLETEPYNRDANGDRVAAYATEAEVEIADQLRHRLEERYLSRSMPALDDEPRVA